MTFEFNADGKYVMVMYPETSEVHISGSYNHTDGKIHLDAEAVDMKNLPKEVAAQVAKIEENFLKVAQKEDMDSTLNFDGNDKIAMTFNKETLNLVRK
ncbi:MAG: hypothetical protein ACKVQS_07880 [Fimbriimonadaceae bacterium]